jgi:hypothetical protein
MHQDCKSRLVTAADEIVQQLRIGQTSTVPQQGCSAKVLD